MKKLFAFYSSESVRYKTNILVFNVFIIILGSMIYFNTTIVFANLASKKSLEEESERILNEFIAINIYWQLK